MRATDHPARDSPLPGRDGDATGAASASLVEVLALLLLAGSVLYNLIGNAPFQHTPTSYGDEVSPINRWIWLFLLAFALPILWLRLGQVIILLRAIWPLLFVFVWFGLTTLWALDSAASTRRFLLFVVALIIFVAVAVGLRSSRVMHHTLAFCCAFVILLDLGSWLAVPNLAVTEAGLAGIHVHKNGAGAIGLYALLVSATYAFVSRRPMARAAWLAVGLLCGVLLILARSATSSIIAIGVSALLPPLVLLLRQSGLVILTMAAWIIVMFGAALFLYVIWAAMEGQDFWAPLYDVSFTQRTDVWAYVLSEIAKRPAGGIGFASFWDIDPALQPSLSSGLWFASGTEFTNESHNGYLDLLVTTGVVGLAGSIIVLGRSVQLAVLAAYRAASNRRNRIMDLPTAAFHLVWLLSFAVHNITESSYFVANIPYASLFLLSALWLERWRLEQTGLIVPVQSSE